MILEEVMNISSNIINISEANISLDDYIDLVCEQCNDILLEAGSNFKVTKEDLTDPKKFKQILNRLEHDAMDPSEKQKLLMKILTNAIGILCIIGGVTSIILVFKSLILSTITILTTGFIALIGDNRIIPAANSNYNKIINKVEKEINNINKKISKTKDESKLDELKKKLEALKEIEQKLIDDQRRIGHILRNNKERARGGIISTGVDGDGSEEYIERLKKYISQEDDPDRKKRLQDHLRVVEKEAKLNKEIHSLEVKLDEAIEKEDKKAEKILYDKLTKLNNQLYELRKTVKKTNVKI